MNFKVLKELDEGDLKSKDLSLCLKLPQYGGCLCVCVGGGLIRNLNLLF